MAKRKFPKDTEEIEWNKLSGKQKQIMTTLTYNCGCLYDVIWDDITTGKVDIILSIEWCVEHDPTIIYNDIEIEE